MDSSDSTNFSVLNQLTYEITRRIRDGERPMLEEYLDRYPDIADEIRDLFPIVTNIELAIRAEPPGPVPARSSSAPHISGYRLGRRLGRGGMGVVYEAEHQLLQRRVAIKVLADSLANESKSRERFRREARVAGRLHHTNIVPIYEVGEDGNTLYFAMQLIEGHGLDRVIVELKRLRIADERTSPTPETSDEDTPRDTGSEVISEADLARFLLRDGLHANQVIPRAEHRGVFPSASGSPEEESPTTVFHHTVLGRRAAEQATESATQTMVPEPMRLNPPDSSSHSRSKWTRYYKALARLGMQVASAVSYAHARGIIHRDIKPSNILLDGAGTAWVTDFGLAREGDSGLTGTADILGTIRYMAPERFNGQCDERSDIYSLGLTLYELLALEPPFRERDRLALTEAICTRPARALRQIDPHVPRDLETIVLKAIEKEPARRYVSADEMAADLRRFLADEPIRARRVSSSEKFYRWCRRNPAFAAANCLAVAGLLATIVILTASNRQIRAGNVALRSALSDRNQALEGQQRALGQREKALVDVQTQRQLAQKNATRAEQLVRLMSTERGLLAGQRGEMADAVLWFTEAARLSKSDETARQANLMRTRAYQSQAVRPLRLFEHSIPREGWVTQLSFSPDSRHLISRAESTDRAWADVRVWDLEPGDAWPLPAGFQRLSAATWSIDGSLLAVGADDGRVAVLQTGSREPLVEVKAAGGDVIDLAFSPHAGHLAIAANRSLSLWNIQGEPRELGRFEHPDRLVCVLISPNGEHIASLCFDGQVRLFRVSGNELLPPHATYPSITPALGWWDPVLAIRPQFLNHGQTLATFPVDFSSSSRVADSVVMVDVETGESRQVPLESGRVAAISPDEGYVFEGHQTATMRSMGDGSSLGSFDHLPRQWTVSAAFHPDGSLLLTGSGERMVRVMSVPKLTPVMPPIEHAQSVTCVAVSPNGRYFATAEANGLVHVRAFPQGGPDVLYARFQPLAQAINTGVSFAAISPDGRYVIPTGRTSYSSQVGVIQVVEIASGEPVGQPLSPGGILLDARFVADSKKVAVVSAETASREVRNAGQSNSGFLHLFDWTTGISPPPVRFESEPRSVDCRRRDGQIAVLCADGNVHIFRPDTLTEIHTWPAHAPCPDVNWYVSNGHLLYSSNGKLLATCGRDSHVRVWDADTGELKVTVPHEGKTNQAAFSHNDRYLATSSWNKNEVRVTDLTTGELASPLLMHPDWAFSVEFSPDDSLLVTSCRDGSARVWNWRTGQLVGRALEHGFENHIARFVHDGSCVLTTSDDNRVRLWETQTGQPLTAPIPLASASLSIAIDSTETHAVLGGFDGRLTILPLGQFFIERDARASNHMLRFAELMSGKRLQAGDEVRLTAAEQLERYKLEWETAPGAFSMDEDSERLWRRHQDACEEAIRAGNGYRYVWNLRQRLAQRNPAENLRDLSAETDLWVLHEVLSTRSDELLAIAATQLIPEVLGPTSPVAAISPDTNLFYLLAGWSGLTSPQTETLLRVAQQACDQHPKNGQARMTLAFSQYRAGQLQAAVDSIHAGRKLGVTGVDNVFVEAMVRHKLGDIDGSKAMFALASAWIQEPTSGAASDSVRLWKETAELLGVDRQLPVAEDVRQAVNAELVASAYPDELTSVNELPPRAALWAACGYWDRAESEFSTAIAAQPGSTLLWYQRALTHLARDDHAAYRNACQTTCEHFHPRLTELSFLDLYWIVWTCLIAPDTLSHDAWPHQMVQQWNEQAPGDPDLNFLHGLSLYRRGEYAMALQRLQETQRLLDEGKPSIGTPVYLMLVRAMVCHRLGQIEEAVRCREKAHATTAAEQSQRLVRDLPWQSPWNRRVTIAALEREADGVMSE